MRYAQRGRRRDVVRLSMKAGKGILKLTICGLGRTGRWDNRLGDSRP